MGFAYRRVLQNLFSFILGVYARYGKFARCKSSRFIEEYTVYLIELLDIIRAFYQNPFAARSADTAEKPERNTYYKRARTTYHEEGKRPLYPYRPLPVAVCKPENKTRNNGEGQSGENDERGVIFSESGYKVLRFSLFARSVFDHIEYFRYRTVVKLLFDLYF